MPFVLLLLPLALLQGCAPVLLAGGATAVAAADDRRTIGSLVDDNNIERKATRALNDEPDMGDDVHINTTSMNGVVLLTGEATTAAQRDRALTLIRDIQGIRRIVNEVRIAEPTAFSSRTHDSWITSKVKANLIGEDHVPANQVKVVTENSVVYLMGLVTQKEGERATEVTRTVDGITRVVKLFEYLD